MLFGDFMRNWFETYKKRRIKGSTYVAYGYAAKHLLPLCECEISDITVFDVQNIVNSMYDAGLSLSTLKHTVTLARQVFEKAVQLGVVTSNPCLYLELPRYANSVGVSAMSEFETFQIFGRADLNCYYSNVFRFLLYSGLRAGELIALTHDDINREGEYISINKSCYNGVVTTTKTVTSIRIIPLTNKLVKILNANKTRAGIVFRNTKGGYINYRSLLKAWHRLQERAGLKESYGLHALRHTYATQLLRSGVDVKCISSLLGHAGVGITLDVYCDVDLRDLRNAVEHLVFRDV